MKKFIEDHPFAVGFVAGFVIVIAFYEIFKGAK